MKKILSIVVVAAVVVAGAWWFFGSASAKPLLAWLWPAEADPLPVQTIRQQDYAVIVPAEGELTGLDTVTVSTPRTPRWDSLKISRIVEEGTIVSAGEELIRFDNTSLNMSLEQNQNTVSRYDQQIDKSRQDVATDTRVLTLDREAADLEVGYADRQVRKDEDIFSRWEIQESVMSAALARYRKEVLEHKGKLKGDLSQADLAILGIERRQADAEVQTARETLSALEVSSPASGVVLYKRGWGPELKVGTEAWPGRPLLEVASLDKLQGQLRVVESEAAGLGEGKPVRVTVTALPGVRLNGTIKRVAKVAELLVNDDPRKYFQVDVLLDVTPELMTRLKPGMRLEGEIEVGRRQGAVVVPKCAVIQKENRFLAFVRGADGRWVERKVEIRDSDHGFYVVDGLKPGEVVCLRHPYEKQELRLPDFNAPSMASQNRSIVIIN
jgi:HlyD family secretion protein